MVGRDPCVFDSDCAGDNCCDATLCWGGSVEDSCSRDGDCSTDICLCTQDVSNECQNTCSNNLCT